jgi:hypothetical protein
MGHIFSALGNLTLRAFLWPDGGRPPRRLVSNPKDPRLPGNGRKKYLEFLEKTGPNIDFGIYMSTD